MFKFWHDRRASKLRKQIADLQSELEAERRRLAVLMTELETCYQCLARDRARVAAEAAALSRQRAESEGTSHESRSAEFS